MDLIAKKDFFGKVVYFMVISILAFIRGIRVRSWDFCPTAEKKHIKVHHWIAGSDVPISEVGYANMTEVQLHSVCRAFWEKGTSF